MQITDDELKIINALKQRQDTHAFGLGVARATYIEQETFWRKKIEETKADQKSIGEELLKLHGIDPNSGEYTIDATTGEILILKDGAYIGI